MINPIKKFKEEQKELAKEIREWKNRRPLKNRNGVELWKIVSTVGSLKHVYRHRHIAYCEFRGRKREEIECPLDTHLPNESLIQTHKDYLEKEMSAWLAYREGTTNETVCTSA